MLSGMNYRELVRDIPNFPQPGILFRDITPVVGNPEAFKALVNDMASPWRNERIDAVVAIEARGYILGAPIAYQLSAAFVPVRKKGKLPWETISSSYELEYGMDTLEMHQDGVRAGQRVLIVDDLLATGGTLKAGAQLVEQLKAQVVGMSVFIELAGLKGRAKLPGRTIHALVTY